MLDGLSIEIPAGTKQLIRGPSGAGKSTLFEILGLLDRPDSGSVWIAGTDTGNLRSRKRATLRETHLGLVFQDFKLVPDLTAWENARLPLEHTGGVTQTETDRLTTLFETLSIADVRTQYPATLSGGERQRVAIGRALANDPRVVLADEPTGQLDPDTATQVLDLLCDVSEAEETALAVISHDRSIRDRFDTVHQLTDGRLTIQDEVSAESPNTEPKEVTEDHK